MGHLFVLNFLRIPLLIIIGIWVPTEVQFLSLGVILRERSSSSDFV
jgi:hypothetical protein